MCTLTLNGIDVTKPSGMSKFTESFKMDLEDTVYEKIANDLCKDLVENRQGLEKNESPDQVDRNKLSRWIKQQLKEEGLKDEYNLSVDMHDFFS